MVARKKPTSKRAKTSTKRAKTSGKKASRKTTAKKTASKAIRKATARKAGAAQRTAAKKTARKKTASRKTAKTAKKVSAKKVAKKTANKAASKAAKAEGAKKTARKSGASAAPAGAKKGGRKGITIVEKAPARPAKPERPAAPAWPPGGGLLAAGAPRRKPLIPSGPKNVVAQGGGEDDRPVLRKSPLGKRQLARFREMLLAKRAELVGDISNMEAEALSAGSGGLSHTPQHMAEQGSDAYDQSLALGLAAADRQLLREIDAALQRIADGTYGICEKTGKPIRLERLEEVPWARYSIEAAREIERMSGR